MGDIFHSQVPITLILNRLSLHANHFYRLHLAVVKRSGAVLDLAEVNGFQVDAANVLVPGGAVVQLERREVGRRSELSRTRKIGRSHTLAMLRTDRNVEVIQDVEGLGYGLEGAVPLRSTGAEKSCTHET